MTPKAVSSGIADARKTNPLLVQLKITQYHSHRPRNLIAVNTFLALAEVMFVQHVAEIGKQAVHTQN